MLIGGLVIAFIKPDKMSGAPAPIAFQELLVSISFLVIMAIVNSMGVIASAGVGVAEKLCAFVMLVPSAYMQSMSAFVAQNIGAKKLDCDVIAASADYLKGYGIDCMLTAFLF